MAYLGRVLWLCVLGAAVAAGSEQQPTESEPNDSLAWTAASWDGDLDTEPGLGAGVNGTSGWRQGGAQNSSFSTPESPEPAPEPAPEPEPEYPPPSSQMEPDELQGLRPSIEMYATDGVSGYTTYHLRAVLPAHMHSIYAIFGDMHNPPHVPAAWMSTDPAADPLAAKATANPLLYGFFPELEFTSYLLLGSLDVDTATTPGGDSSWRQWDAATPLTLGVAPGPMDDFSMFYMDPHAAGNFEGRPLIAQLTLPSEEPFFVRLGMQGKHTSDGMDDWNLGKVVWLQKGEGEECPAGTQGTDCMFDIDECAAQPCAIDEECWEGLNEYACKLPAGPNEPYWEGEWGAAQRPTPRQAGEVEDSRLDAVLNALLAGGINTTTLFEIATDEVQEVCDELIVENEDLVEVRHYSPSLRPGSCLEHGFTQRYSLTTRHGINLVEYRHAQSSEQQQQQPPSMATASGSKAGASGSFIEALLIVVGFGVSATLVGAVIWKLGLICAHGKNGAVAGKGHDKVTAPVEERNRLIGRYAYDDDADDDGIDSRLSLAGTV